MAKRTSGRIKLPDDFLGIVEALLRTPPPPKVKAERKAKKRAKSKAKK